LVVSDPVGADLFTECRIIIRVAKEHVKLLRKSRSWITTALAMEKIAYVVGQEGRGIRLGH
jgi:hypothetical protein